MVNTGSHGTNTPFVKELWTMYSSHSGRICCKQWAQGLCVRRYWLLYSVNVSVPSQAVCGSDRVLGRRLRSRLRLRQVALGQVWTSRRLSCHIGPRQEVEFGSEHHNDLRGKSQHNTEHSWLTNFLFFSISTFLPLYFINHLQFITFWPLFPLHKVLEPGTRRPPAGSLAMVPVSV